MTSQKLTHGMFTWIIFGLNEGNKILPLPLIARNKRIAKEILYLFKNPLTWSAQLEYIPQENILEKHKKKNSKQSSETIRT